MITTYLHYKRFKQNSVQFSDQMYIFLTDLNEKMYKNNIATLIRVENVYVTQFCKSKKASASLSTIHIQ